MLQEQVHSLLQGISQEYALTGSKAMCDPAPTDTDEDYIVLAKADSFTVLEKAGFKMTSDPEYEGGHWMSTWRFEEFNLVITDDAVFFDRYVAATLLGKKRNLLIKQDRIALFQRILYGPAPEQGACKVTR